MNAKYRALVYLEHDVDAFRVSERQLDLLKNQCSHIDFMRVRTDSQVENLLPDADIFVTWRFRENWYPLGKKLIAICTPAAGDEGIEKANWTTVPLHFGTFHGKIMAESLLAMITAFNRRFPQLLKNKDLKLYDRNILSPTRMLHGQHVVIIGYGHIGTTCAKVLKAFGCRISGVRRDISKANEFVDTLLKPEQLREVLPDADHVISILPANRSTDSLITYELFRAMKRSAYFYNIGRGNCCSESVLVKALEEQLIVGAGLDVFEKEPLPSESKLWSLPNVLIMPHGSAICREYLDCYFVDLAAELNAICT